uniref:Uncharacterized protein n=1 Tax=Knipowitschia caucasica TaxID=637954 RepID=A0AAV2IWA7_KNICA
MESGAVVQCFKATVHPLDDSGRGDVGRGEERTADPRHPESRGRLQTPGCACLSPASPPSLASPAPCRSHSAAARSTPQLSRSTALSHIVHTQSQAQSPAQPPPAVQSLSRARTSDLPSASTSLTGEWQPQLRALVVLKVACKGPAERGMLRGVPSRVLGGRVELGSLRSVNAAAAVKWIYLHTLQIHDAHVVKRGQIVIG